MSETYQPDPNHPSFCQICGRAVASEADRMAGRAFHCGLCNEVRLAGPASTGYTAPGYAAPGYTDPGYSDPGSRVDPTAAGAQASGPNPAGGIPPFIPGAGPFPPAAAAVAPNPVLAGLLGLIPGVGAMYNGQYAKGIVHLIVFAVLVNIADSHDIFGLFVAGWIFYQAIEAYHTARARRDGTPPPNPFGLNDIGERFGFGKAWPMAPAPGSATPFSAAASPAAESADTPAGGHGAGVPPPTYQAPAANWGAPWESYRQPPATPWPPSPHAGYAAPVPPFPPASTVYDGPPFDPSRPGFPSYPIQRNRFPAGAIWLIALGTLFLLNTSGVFRGFPFRVLLPLFFLGLGIWTFVRKMTDTGYGLADDGTSAYRIRVFRAARGAVWLILLGVIFFLADFNILSWGRSWPLFLILAGVMTFLERAVYSGTDGAKGYGYPAPGASASSAGTPGAGSGTAPAAETGLTTTSDAIVPNQEGK